MRKIYLLLTALTASLLIVSFSLMSFAADDYESILVTGSAKGFTASKVRATSYNTRKVYCTLETANIRYRIDGTDPSSTVGHLMEISQNLTLTNYQDVSSFKAITSGTVSGNLRCTFWK